MKNAAFTLKGYRFPKALIDLTNIRAENNEFKMDLVPTGRFNTETHEFELKFSFVAKLNNSDMPAIAVDCEGRFEFADAITFEEIPDYFYPNSIAIIFPYVRAFVSTLSLQANYRPIIIPTMNLSDLSESLRQHVVVE